MDKAANLRARTELMQQIAEVVKESGWTQVEAAAHCGITPPRINHLLRGRVSRFSIDALVSIAAALGATVHFELQVASAPSLARGDSRQRMSSSLTTNRN
jgi:predicted XRE-type DNA-binding protein